MNNHTLSASGLTKYFGGRCVLSDFNLRVSPGEIVGLLGPSGSGKSTIFNILAGVIEADTGQDYLGNYDLTELNIEARSKYGIGYVSQSSDLFETLTVQENLEIALNAKHDQTDQLQQLLTTVLRVFELTTLKDNTVGKLSGGQRKLVELAFIICTKPSILLLDEPFSGLDPIKVSQFSSHMRMLARIGLGIVLTDHKVRDALAVVQRAYVINNGRMIQSGEPDKVARDELVRKVFLGEHFSI